MDTVVLEKTKRASATKVNDSLFADRRYKPKKEQLTEAELDNFIEELSEQVNRNMSYRFMFNQYGKMLQAK